MAVWAKNIFCPKVDALEQKLKAPPIGSKKMPESAKIHMKQHPPPGTAEAVFSGGEGANTAAVATNRAIIVGRVVPYARRRSN